jgi:hypothetical protein
MMSKPSPRKSRAPYYSKQPWFGFSEGDNPRAQPLPQCKSARCRRTKMCVAAYDGLYCRRTHFAPSDTRVESERASLQKQIDRIPRIDDPYDVEWKLERIAHISDIRRAHFKKMTERWKSGAFDHLYGKYRPHGVLMTPPPRIYVEKPSKKG